MCNYEILNTEDPTINASSPAREIAWLSRSMKASDNEGEHDVVNNLHLITDVPGSKKSKQQGSDGERENQPKNVQNGDHKNPKTGH